MQSERIIGLSTMSDTEPSAVSRYRQSAITDRRRPGHRADIVSAAVVDDTLDLGDGDRWHCATSVGRAVRRRHVGAIARRTFDHHHVECARHLSDDQIGGDNDGRPLEPRAAACRDAEIDGDDVTGATLVAATDDSRSLPAAWCSAARFPSAADALAWASGAASRRASPIDGGQRTDLAARQSRREW
jgi:hypothetical protein